MQREIQILSPDGQTRVVPLNGERISLGRSSITELCYPDDSGLSRQHLAFEKEGQDWLIRDLGSKNGTLLNGTRISAPQVLTPGDRVTAGHLILIFDSTTIRAPRPVVFFEESADVDQNTSSTVITGLAEVIKEDKTRPEESAAQVSALIKAGNELAAQRPLPELFRVILGLAMEGVQAERGVLMILEDNELVIKANKGEGFRISSAVRDRVIKGLSVLVRNTALDDAFKERRSIVEQHIRTLMAVPLQTQDKIIGLIYVDSPGLIREFTDEDLRLMTVMSNHVANRIEHARYAEMEQARQLMARELEQAAEIQRSFLPAVAPQVSGLDLAGHNAACRTVGGDYFDFFAYPNGHVAMVLGDVSGKGMPASLLMMGLQARVQNLLDEPPSLAQAMTRINRITSANCPRNRFISFFMCILDPETGELIYANAGHNPPVIVRQGGDGAFDSLEGGGPPLGILSAFEYQQYKAQMNKGDILAIYSDGVTEAPSPDDEEFETGNLAKTLAAYADQGAAIMIEEVNKALTAWTVGAPPADDITLIVARLLP
ncbi:MAG TPA: SpoIIE family protein phosphatase [Bryobacteraceae bacterium]|jgi:serine phosphatase RsbU (regulator of sigma subunit)/pSer/pThr/pTyr-binding forkhead associated (FHA) protein